MKDVALALAWGLPGAAVTALTTAWFGRPERWRPGRFERMLRRYYERKLDRMTGLTAQQRSIRQLEIEKLVGEPPDSRPFAEQFRSQFLIAVVALVLAVVIRFWLIPK